MSADEQRALGGDNLEIVVRDAGSTSEDAGTSKGTDIAKGERPARKQVTTYVNYNRANEAPPGATGYNIWYNRHTGGESLPKNRREKAPTKLDLKRDSGFTKGSFHENAYICLDFAHGCCMKGADCGYLHKAPPPNFREEMLRDCFGRDKFRLDRQDMGGVGNFERDNRTLYLGGISVRGNPEMTIRKHFGQFGRIEYIRILLNKAVAFVRYERRCCAEFAKEAMNLQSMDDSEILNIRWAVEDPNPKSLQESNDEMTKEFLRQFLARKDFDNPDGLTRQVVDGMVALDAGEYPDTSDKFNPALQQQQQMQHLQHLQQTDPAAYAQWYAQYIVWWQQQQAAAAAAAANPPKAALPAPAAPAKRPREEDAKETTAKKAIGKKEEDEGEDDGAPAWFENPRKLAALAKNKAK